MNERRVYWQLIRGEGEGVMERIPHLISRSYLPIIIDNLTRHALNWPTYLWLMQL